MKRAFGVVALALFGCGDEPAAPGGGEFPEVELPGTWSVVAPLPEPVVNGGAVAVGGQIYVVGGDVVGQSEASAKAFRYDPPTNSWERLTDLPEGLRTPGVGVLDGSVVVVGGNLHSDQLSPRANVWRWDENSRSWEHHSVLPLPSTGPDVASTAQGILATGLGSLSLPPGDSTAFLANGSSTWQYAAPAPVPASWAGGVGSEAWIVGGNGHARFDAENRVWMGTGSLPTSGFIVGAWSIPGRKHVVTRIATTASHWVLEGSATTWVNAKAPENVTTRFDATAAAIGDTLYLIGGTLNGAPSTKVDVFTGY